MPYAGIGLATSLAVHAVLLAILALIMIARHASLEQVVLEVIWAAEEPPTPRKDIPLSPIRLGSLDRLRPTRTTQQPTPDESNTSRPSAPPVRPADVEGMLAGRLAGNGGAIAGEWDPDGKAAQAVRLGLGWLRRQQRSDGRWVLHEGYPDAGSPTVRTDTGATALALLAFLGAGQTHRTGDHQAVVQKGLDWLVSVQKPNGDLHDHTEQGRRSSYYAHAMATIALCEALALTRDEKLIEPAQRAVDFLLESQHPVDGGWKYRPLTELNKGDLSVTGWCLMALNTARMAGLEVPDEAYQRVSVFLDSVQDERPSRYRYEPTDPPGSARPAMTAEGLLCRQWLGWPRDYAPMKAGIAWLLESENRPEWAPGRRNLYLWYYTAQVLHNVGGPEWEDWYRQARSEIVAHQLRTGRSVRGRDVRGSWDPTNPPGSPWEHAQLGGRLYLTSLCLLVLETPYRHRPLYAE